MAVGLRPSIIRRWKVSSEYNKRKREAAIQYLKDRNKHLLTTGYVPTDSAHTNVLETMKKYVEEMKEEGK
jgi:hypothetical protein